MVVVGPAALQVLVDAGPSSARDGSRILTNSGTVGSGGMGSKVPHTSRTDGEEEGEETNRTDSASGGEEEAKGHSPCRPCAHWGGATSPGCPQRVTGPW